MTYDGAHHYSYDAENHLSSTAGWSYTYNNDGERVRKANGSAGTVYWGGSAGDALAESDLSGNMKEEYIFFNGKRVARRDLPSGTVHYYFSDDIGSTSVVTNADGSVVEEDLDYYPYGGIVAGSTDNVPQNYKFNGKERDAESGLDNFGARFDASNLGRFMTPDPLSATPLHLVNPQRWNMYAYVVNNPTNYVDPDGNHAIAVNFSKQDPGVGHEGIISVHQNGTATYARFGPMTKGTPFGKGQVKSQVMSTRVRFGQNGSPTSDSYAALANEAGKIEQQDPSTVFMNFFKTSESDTVGLDNWIRETQAGEAAPYAFCTPSNCAGFVDSGLLAAHAINIFEAGQLSIVPNIFRLELDFLSNENYKPKPHINEEAM